LTVMEHWSSDVSGVDEDEINSYAQGSKPYSIHSYRCQVKSMVEHFQRYKLSQENVAMLFSYLPYANARCFIA
jgi:hypothetical protein